MTKVEATYPSSPTDNYIICSQSEGIDVFIDTNIDAKFKIFLHKCPNGADKTAENFYPMGVPIQADQSVNGKLHFPIGAYKYRGTYKVFVECDNESATFSVRCENNQG